MGAADASTSYGFGASCVRTTAAVARNLARVAEKPFVVMDGGVASTLGVDSLGEAHKLNMKLEDFSDIFSVRNKFPAHINVLEGEALVLFLRWLLRTKRRHSSRVVVLLDSAVVLGAAAKGRSSSQLNRLETLAGSLQVHLVFVPSSENPADLPSRGLRRRRVRLRARDVQQLGYCQQACLQKHDVHPAGAHGSEAVRIRFIFVLQEDLPSLGASISGHFAAWAAHLGSALLRQTAGRCLVLMLRARVSASLLYSQ